GDGEPDVFTAVTTLPAGTTRVGVQIESSGGTTDLHLIDIIESGTARGTVPVTIPAVPEVPSARDIMLAYDPTGQPENKIPVTDGEDGIRFEDKPTGGGSGSISDGAVTTAKIADDAVTEAKLASGVRSKLNSAGALSLPAGRPAVYNAGGAFQRTIARLATSLAASNAGNANAELRIAMPGDSIVARPAVAQGLADALTALGFADAWGRFITMDTSTGDKPPMTGHSITFGAGWGDADTFASDYGGPARKYASASDGAGDTIDIACTTAPDWAGTSKILYRRHAGGGSFRWRVDAGSWTTVSTSGSEGLASATISAGGDLDIEVTAGTVTLSGVVLESASGVGFSIFKCGNGGSTAAQHDNASNANTQAHFAPLAPDVFVLSVGGNDVLTALNSETDPATVADDVKTKLGAVLDTLLAYRDAESRGVPVLYLGLGDSGVSGIEDAELEPSRASTYEAVTSRAGVGMVDSRQVLGEHSAGVYADSAHPNATGGLLLGYPLASLLAGSASKAGSGGSSLTAMSEAEAETGTATTARSITAAVLKAAVEEHAPSGGGDMSTATYDPDDNGVIGIAQGGTGASTASGARTALALGSAAQAALIDDDTMATASASNVPSAESVKAYVDANAGGGSGPITGVTAADTAIPDTSLVTVVTLSGLPVGRHSIVGLLDAETATDNIKVKL
ncbi:SGNH/GDSL hydrolase family protein, partial [Pseudoalteromonas marina]|uniref:SGNH/GDSL hydrolase family protein n=1 Tax=Pseudoalteromonas marina TaxID=267375 RepID=UPI003C37B95F